MPLAGLSIFDDERYRQATRPLFSSGEVGAVEWTVDSWRMPFLSGETTNILEKHGDQGLLIGHGVHYPLLDAKAGDLRAAWLRELRQDVKKHRYRGVSVHFGFSTGWLLDEGAPLPAPYCPEAVAVGRQAMADLAEAAGCPVGIENLALALSRKDVEEQGRFMEELLEEVDGYLLLDLHNIYCQSCNFGRTILDLVGAYPLKRVREIHVSGGSWSEHGPERKRVRRDTHDGRVPEEVLAALPHVIALCPGLQFVLLEKLPHFLETEDDAAGLREDFLRMKAVMNHAAQAA